MDSPGFILPPQRTKAACQEPRPGSIFPFFPPGERPGVLDWLRSKGEGRLTRIDDTLICLLEAERRAGSGR
jgi:hypothetical protein